FMRYFAAIALCVSIQIAAAQEAPEVTKAREELSRIERLVEAGGLPPRRLEEARALIREAEDQAVLRRTLYGALQVQDLTEPMTSEMLTSARRLVESQQSRVDRMKILIEEGVVARTGLTPLLQELDNRQRTLALAEQRDRLWNELLAMARAEEARQAAAEADRGVDERSADEVVAAGRVAQLEREYARQFGRPLPVSARGDTTFHRSLGFDHTGRLDVGVNPDSIEGTWLRGWLDRVRVPYLAFRSAIRGVATAPHIHIGPPSSRLRIAD
ncbi:MAG: hypothetical protein JNK87_28235, partial [Bryobacterales bacterium]|nr:hypothetical protein [Bryobacterales bacterium]